MASTSERINLIRGYSEGFDVGPRRQAERWLLTNDALNETVWGLRDDFDHILTVEANIDSYKFAQMKCFDQANMSVIYGSFTSWANLLDLIREPCLFWLVDPRPEEVEAILRRNYPHVILMEDVSEDLCEKYDVLLEGYMRRGYPESSYEIDDGIVRIAPIVDVENLD